MRKRYYLLHPLKWLRDIALSFKWAYQRMTRGFADVDWYNLYDWLIDVLAPMFEEYAENHYGHPAIAFTDEQWTQYLSDIARHLRNASEDQTVELNQFKEEHDAYIEARFGSLYAWTDEHGNVHHSLPEAPEFGKEISDKYYAKMREIDEWRLKEAQTALKMIGDFFFDMWD